MNKKRKVVFLISSALIVSLAMVNFVAAQSDIADRLRGGMGDVMSWIQEILTPLFSVLLNVDSADDFLFAKILVFLLLLMVIITVLKKVPNFGDNYALVFLISLIISILSVRFIPDNNFFQGMLLPYGTLGVALIVFLPFLIFSFFVHTSVPGTIGRRLAWIVYGITFLVLWGMREYGDSTIGGANWLYALGILLIVVMFVLDKGIHRYFGLHELGRFEEISKSRQRRRILKEIDELNEDHRAGRINESSYRAEISRLNSAYRNISG